MNGFENKGNGRRGTNAWKRYGAFFIAGMLAAGSVTGAGTLLSGGTVQAEEQQDVTLNIADDSQEDAAKTSEENTDETQSAEEETEAADAAQSADEAEKTEDGETQEADEKTGLNIAKDDETETEAASDKSFAQIETVEADADAIVTTDASNLVENCMPSIVSINTKSVEEVQMYYYGSQEYEVEGAGSGIIVAQNDEELLIATNSHVVADSTELSVSFTVDAEDPEDLVVSAKIKGMDKNYELAVIAVRLEDISEEVLSQLKIATLGSSDKLKVGETAIAIGNALGYGQSVTCGIISALNREVTIDNFSKELIMTDASINFGNSGGALLNSKGQVIGINVAKEAGDSAEGMGYSIPIDTAIPVLENLVNKETRDQMSNAERGYLGATVVDVSTDAKELYNMPEGAFVYEVSEDSAAEKAGIKKGDVITKFDGESVTDKDDLVDKLSYYAVGETVTIEVQTANNGEYVSREVEVTLQEGTDVQTEEEQDSAPSEDDGNTGDDGQYDGERQQEFGFPMDEFGDGFFPFGYGEDDMF